MCTSAAVGDAGGDVVPGGGLPGRVRRVARQAHRHEQTDTRAVVRLEGKSNYYCSVFFKYESKGI